MTEKERLNKLLDSLISRKDLVVEFNDPELLEYIRLLKQIDDKRKYS